MTRAYLVVYEKREKSWSALCPDAPTCRSLGETIDETRSSMSNALGAYVTESIEDCKPITRPTTTAVHFPHPSEGHGIEYWVIERLKIEVPA